MASEIRVNKINSRTGVGTITLSPTGVDFTGIATVATLKATTGIVTTLSVTGTTTLNGNLDLQDNDKILIGTGDDLEIYHDGSNSYIKEDGTGSLKIQGTNLHIESAAGEAFVMCTADGAVDLYYDNSKKLETKSDGVDITGELQCDTLDVDGNIDLDGSKITFDSGGNVLKWADNVAAYFGDGNDLRIYHDGSNSWITENGTGSLKIRSTAGSVQILGTTSNDNMAVFTVDGASELYYDNSKKFETTSTGVKIDNSSTTDMLLFDVGGTNFAKIGHNSASGTDILDIRSEGHTRFLTNGSNERLRITSAGDMGLGTSSPNSQSGYTSLTLNNATSGSIIDLRHNDTALSGGRLVGLNNEFGLEARANSSSAQISFYVNNAYRGRWTVNGLCFGNDTAAANALDDYEEGTWTPTAINFDGSVTINSADYVKVGKLVHINMYISFSNTVDTSNVLIGGLPFTVTGENNHYSLLTAHSNGNIPDLAMRAQGTTTQLTAVYLNNSDGDAKPNYNHVRGQFIIAGGTYYST